jgi:hypothetical protein
MYRLTNFYCPKCWNGYAILSAKSESVRERGKTCKKCHTEMHVGVIRTLWAQLIAWVSS